MSTPFLPPFTLAEVPGWPFTVILDARKRIVAVVYEGVGSRIALLMAAAPEMLGALEALTSEELVANVVPDEDLFDREARIWAAADVAVERAKGSVGDSGGLL